MGKKRGRPPTLQDQQLKEIVPVRMTTAERERYERIAAKTNKTMSEWVRGCLLRAARRSTKGN